MRIAIRATAAPATPATRIPTSRVARALLAVAGFAAAAAVLATPTPLPAQTPHVAGVTAESPPMWLEAAELLEHGARAWNGGSLDGFVSDYTEDATFVTGTGVVRGRAAIRERYAPRFAPGAVRDSLSFRLLDVDRLGPSVSNVVAVWVLARGDSVTSTGPTSLVLKRSGGRWRIAHDHSS